MAQESWLVKPVSSACNLRCRYCFYRDVAAHRKVGNYGRMSEEVLRKTIGQICRGLSAKDQLRVAFQGGEPTLAGLDYFRLAAELLEEMAPGVRKELSLQTNGILLTDEWCDFLRRNHFLVGLSLDGDHDLHDENRVDAEGKGTWARVMEAKRRLERSGVPYNVLCTLTARHARCPERLWNFFRKQNVRYLQFTPCLASFDAVSEPWALTPERFESFYTRLLPLWERGLQSDEPVSVKFFDDLLHLMTRKEVTACGLTGRCTIQNVVEADGSVYPCDFYVLDEWRLGSVLAEGEMPEPQKAERFLQRERPELPICGGCRFRYMCGGGCRRMRGSMYVNAGGTFCGYRAFLEKNEEKLERIASLFAER